MMTLSGIGIGMETGLLCESSCAEKMLINVNWEA